MLGGIAFGNTGPYRMPENARAVGSQPPRDLARPPVLDRTYRIEDVLRPDLGDRESSQARKNVELHAMKDVACRLRLPLPEHCPMPFTGDFLELVRRDGLLVTDAFGADAPRILAPASNSRATSRFARASASDTSG